MNIFFLEDDIIGLRNLTEKDADGNYSSWFNNQEICLHNSHHRFPMCQEEIDDYIRGLTHNHTLMVFAVVEKSSNNHIGNIALQQLDLINRQGEIALMFGEKKYWGRGYATRAAFLLINHGFKELGLNRIYFGTSDTNAGMQSIGKKLNFKKVGVRRKAFYKDGSFHDIFDYDLLRDEWDEKKEFIRR